MPDAQITDITENTTTAADSAPAAEPAVEKKTRGSKSAAAAATTTAADSEPSTNSGMEASGASADLSGKTVTINIPSQEGDAGAFPVEVGLNGTLYRFPRDTDVEVPWEVYEILKNARPVELRHMPDGSIKDVSKPRFPMSVIG